MTAYYISRLGVSIAFGLLWFLTGTVWWVALLVGLVTVAWFLWAPRSGRYSVHPELGVTALRRDERTQVINDKAARNGFIITMLALAALAIYFSASTIPIQVLSWVLILGAMTYLISDLVLRRSA